MKKTIFAIAILTLASAACRQTTISTNTTGVNQQTAANRAANANSMNTNAAMNHNTAGMSHDRTNHAAMNHSEMQSSPNAASAPYDLQFIDTMIAHHQGAVEMAQAAMRKTQNAELKKFSQKIIDDQQKEIAQMKEWREKWFAGKPPAMNMEMPGMADSMKDMDVNRMNQASGKDFDLMFIEMMTPHHEGATVMSREALQKAEHPEIKTLAQNIIKAQEAEIKQMNQWKTQWAK